MADEWLNYAFDQTAGYEGFSATPYWDVNAWRIGHGSDTVTLADGSVHKVTRDTPAITRQDAGRDLARSLPIYANTIIGQVGRDKWEALPHTTRGSLASVGYNYGSLPASLSKTITAGGDPVDVAVAINKLGRNKGINNPERRTKEAVAAIQDDPAMANKVANTQVAQANDVEDVFGAAFGAKPSGTPTASSPAKKPVPSEIDDVFGAAFGKAAAQPTAVAAAPAAPVQNTPDPSLTSPGGMNVARGPRITSDVNKLLAGIRPSVPYEPGDSPGPKGIQVTEGSSIGKADSGFARGLQDVGDTASVYGMKAATAAAKAMAGAGIIDQKTADAIGQTSENWDTTTAAGRKAWEAAHPGQTWGGIIPTDPASLGRLGGQIVGAAPLGGVSAKVFGGLAGLVTNNPLLRTIFTGAGVNATQAAATLRSSDMPVTDQLVAGAALGGIFGGGAHVVVKAGATIFDKLFGKGYSGKSLDVFRSWLDELGITPEKAQAELAKLGPEATYADLDQALRTQAAAIAGLGGKPTQITKDAFGARAASGPGRTADKINEILGPAPDITATEEAITAAAQKQAEPHYTAAKASGGQIDASPADDWLTQRLESAKGDTKTALKKFQSYLYSERDVPKLDANGSPVLDANGNKIMEKQTHLDNTLDALHQARIEMDADINALKRTPEGSARNVQLRAMQDARNQLDTIMKSNPDMAAGDQTFATYMKTKESFETGQTVFSNKVNADDLARLVASATPEQLAMLRFGARGAIDKAISDGTRGELAAAESMFGKKSSNRDKLEILFPGQADQVLELVRSNATFRATENKVLAPSGTAELTTAQKARQPQKAGLEEWVSSLVAGFLSGSHFGPESGALTAIGSKAFLNLLHGMQNAGVKITNADLARILSASSGERNKITNALLAKVRRTTNLGTVEKGLNLGAKAALAGTRQQSVATTP